LRKLTAFLCSAPVGLATGLLAWFVAGGAQATLGKVAPVEAAVAELRIPRPAVVAQDYVSIADLIAAPLFAPASGPGAVADSLIRLDGISLSRQRTAALISINNAPAEWLRPGETRGDITLQQVAASRVVVDTPFGTKEIGLGQSSGAIQPPPAVPDTTPAGFRSPPPPASAPGSK
jgi:hypothetical protein